MDGYLWLKALHVLAIISWMAGLLYLPRLFVYHADKKAGSETSETFKIMERRLYRFIMTPAMIVSFVSGIGLIGMLGGSAATAGWLHLKILLVLIMAGLHGWMGQLLRRFADDDNRHRPRYFRVLNEMPTVLMIGIVILVIVQPF